ncbi:MAG: aminotransferase class III-fold pyridoxal phosphate-dependent enzyme, partial [Anaerolineales bacterium]|nr:aminotransferase class III-fold pyridoxal phosphate-dependent enzyme [Anaerolineales bacterium]
GAWFMARLSKIQSPMIREVRGKGLMIGVELKQKAAPYLQALMNQHQVLALPAGMNVLRFLPPLVIEQSDLARVGDAVEAVLTRPAATAVEGTE